MFAKAKYLHDTSLPQQLAAEAAHLPGQDVPWLVHRREQAVARFNLTGYPTRHVESWRFTDVKPMLTLVGDNARPHQGEITEALHALDALPPAYRAVFVNGNFSTALSQLPNIAGVEVTTLARALNAGGGHVEHYLGVQSGKDETHGLAQLSLAFARDGLVLRVEEGAELDQPLIVAQVFTGGAQAEKLATRHVLLLKAGSKATVIEYIVGVEDAVYASNATTEITLEAGAELTHVVTQNASSKAAEISVRYLAQEAKSRYHGLVLTEGARICRNETQIQIYGEGAHADLCTVQLVRGDRHADSTTQIRHVAPNATSNQHCRQILDDHAKGAWQGETIVARGAQKTDAQQLNKNLILSRTATLDVKPELEIYADDVKCAHGATTGELDAMALFYLMSRGIAEADAKRLLVEAFADNAIDDCVISDEWKAVLRARVAQWMGAKHG